MDAQLTTIHGPWRLLVAATVALTLLMALGATSASAASPTACRVRNTDTGKAYTTLQAAIDAARKDDRLTVQGTCVGKTVIDVKLVIEGVRTANSGKPTLSGAGKSRVVTIPKGVRVRMRSLEIVRGSASSGGGISNQGTLTLIDLVVRGNRADSSGGGIYNIGTLTLTGFTCIRDNRAHSGAGVHNILGGILTMNGAAAISRNGATPEGSDRGIGGGVVNDGTLTMNDFSAIHHNHLGDDAGVSNWGTMTMNDSSAIRDNTAEWGGGGISNHRGVVGAGAVTMNDTSSIHGNRGVVGGGVSNEGFGSLTMNDSSSIHDNRAVAADGTPGQGGGIWYGSSSRDDFVGVTCGPGGNVYGNTPDDCHVE